MEIIRVAGIDPGMRTAGYGIVNYNLEKNEIWASNCGAIRTPEKLKGIDAILFMIEELKKVSDRECFSECSKIVVEFPAVFYSPKFQAGSLTPLAAVSGASMALFQDESRSRVVPVYPTVWNGRKKKEDMAVIIQNLIGHYTEWEFDDLPTRKGDFEHTIDAIGMAYWLCEREYFESSKGTICTEKTKMKSGLN